MLPSATVMDAQQFGWLVHLWSLVFGLGIASLWVYIFDQHPGLSLVQICNKVLGRYGGGIVSFCYILFFIQITAWVTRNVSDYVHVAMMPRTPSTVIHLSCLVVCAYAVIKGIRVISLVSVFIVPYVFVAFWVPFTVMLTEWQWRNFRIPSEFHLWPTIVETKYALGLPFMESIAFMMIFPLVQGKLKTALLGGTASAGMQVALSVFFVIGILGVHRASHLLYPEYTIFREMVFSNFMEHFESILSVNVLLIVFVKVSVILYCTVTAIAQLFAIRSRAAITIPLIWVISAYSLLFANIGEYMKWIRDYLFAYYLPFGVGFPVLLLVVHWLKNAGKVAKSA